MSNKFSVNVEDYFSVPCECPDCHVHYQLRLRRDHSALYRKANERISIRCPDCARANKSKHQ